MSQESTQEYLIRYKIPKLGIEDRAIVESKTQDKAEELLQRFLEEKHRCDIFYVIVGLEIIPPKR